MKFIKCMHTKKEHFSSILYGSAIFITIVLTYYYSFAGYESFSHALENISLINIVLLSLGFIFLVVRVLSILINDSKKYKEAVSAVLALPLFAFSANAVFVGRLLNLVVVGSIVVLFTMQKDSSCCDKDIDCQPTNNSDTVASNNL